MDSDSSDNESNFSGFESDDLPLADLIDSDDEFDDSDKENESVVEDENWTVNDRSDRSKKAFCGPEPGPRFDLDPDQTEWNFVEMFFPMMLVELLVEQTNLFARQKMEIKHDKSWRPVSVKEMMAWLGIRIYMSIVQLPQMAMYWSTDILYGNFSVRRIMTRDRFMKVLQYLHCNDKTKMKPKGHPEQDKLFLIRPFLDVVKKMCLTLYNPHRNVSIDEAMVKFRGRLGFRQFMPLKPARYGVKVWVRADPVNGYVNDFQVYTGKDANTAEVGLATRVVLDLSHELRGKWHIVNVDNFFTSPKLFDELLKQETYARGTVRSNRKGYPVKQLGKKTVKTQGDFVFATKGEQLASVWMDKKAIYTLSTAENPKDIDATVLRKTRSGEVHEVQAPRTIPEYNQNMNGVDHADQMRTEYPTFRTSRKWWTYMFFFLLDTAITNGYVVMRESPFHQQKSRNGKPKDRTVLDFRMNLSRQLIGDYCDNGSAVAKLATVKAGHFPGQAEKRGRCRQCAKEKRRRECHVICLECQVHICVPCFKDWHVDLANSM
ncbi:piggyBac transposable element-derived protein 4-like [Dreissena polymorpha]|uniref:PiggyBac transposable element-derived protein domain-containing protein n=1 Tax=Dreissena polymorpha TaxID=45954 RepID=A0A9D4FGN8_DREPO|nr:piggyBac transposable element-derived protein 4-like [Dreissena polymorpha]KAH3797952.1 hypothetical protein DPMN_151542 [Dreissena polymorpha]